MSAKKTLHVHVGEPLALSLARVADTMYAIDRGESPTPRFDLAFEDMAQLLAVFTPKRWELLNALGESGPTSILALARRLGRDYKNVHTDVGVLLEWGVIEKNARGQIVAPFSEIAMDVQLPQQKAA